MGPIDIYFKNSAIEILRKAKDVECHWALPYPSASARDISKEWDGIASEVRQRVTKGIKKKQNVLVITKYKGLDPENSSSSGIDNNIYPRPRVFSIGANLDF